MTKLIITLDITNERPEDTYNGNGVTWGRLLELLGMHTPTNKDLSIRDGLSAPIDKTGLMIGDLRIEVENPGVPERQFAPGVVVREKCGILWTKSEDRRWVGVYTHGAVNNLDETWDDMIRSLIKSGATIIHDPAADGSN